MKSVHGGIFHFHSLKVKQLANSNQDEKLNPNRFVPAVIRIGFHNVCHVVPPFPVDHGIRALRPFLWIINLDITK
jgi:hypothetical protein